MATKKSAPVKAAKPAPKAPAKAAPAKKAAPAPAKKVAAPAKKAAPAPAKKVAAPAKKAAPAPAKKVVAPAKKAAPAPAKKVVAPAKKAAPAPAKKVVAPAKKAAPAPAKKVVVPAKKAAPVPAKKVVAPAKKVAPAPAPAKKVAVPAKKVVAPAPKVAPKKVPPVKVPEKEREDRRPVVIKQAKVVTEDLALKRVAIKPVKEVKVPKINVKSSVPYQPGYVPLDKRVEEDKPNTPLVKYNDADLNEFREIIGKKLAAAKKELAYLQGMFTRKDADGESEEARYMTMEDGTISMEREQLGQMASRQVTYIDHLEKALIRIENKTYGICRVTGKLIDKARLRAVPHATLSLEAKLGLHKSNMD